MIDRFRYHLQDTRSQIVLGVFLALAGVMAIEASQWTYRWQSEITSRSGVTTLRIAHKGNRLKLKTKGEVEFSEAENDIVRLGQGAFFELEEKWDGERRRWHVTRLENGELKEEYFVGRRAQPIDAEARAWIGEVLLKVYRRTGFDAENRVARILERGGVDAVLAEIEEISMDSVESIYFQELLKQSSPKGSALAEVILLAGQKLSSDYHLAMVFSQLSADALAEAEVQKSFRHAVAGISSDYHLRHTLSHFLPEPEQAATVDLPLASTLLESSHGLSSDFEMASFLIHLLQVYPEERLPKAFFDSLHTVGSDFEQRRVATLVLERHPGPESIQQLLNIAPGIGNDFELANLLVGVAETYPEDQPLPADFFSTLGAIGSDFEHARVLDAVLHRGSLDPGSLDAVLRSARQIQSDFALAELLRRIATEQVLGEDLRSTFEDTLATVGSNFERQRVEEVLAAVGPRESEDIQSFAAPPSEDEETRAELQEIEEPSTTEPTTPVTVTEDSQPNP